MLRLRCVIVDASLRVTYKRECLWGLGWGWVGNVCVCVCGRKHFSPPPTAAIQLEQADVQDPAVVKLFV